MSVAPPPMNRNGTTNETPPEPRPQDNAWSLNIARVAGIPIRLHFTFLLFLVWIGLVSRGTNGWGSAALILSVFVCVVLHELGHSLVALRYGIPVADITLYPIGGVARIEKRPSARQELGIALAGPMVNVVIAALLYVGLTATGGGASFAGSLRFGGVSTVREFLQTLLSINLGLALFNMVPAFPMDGGRVLRAALALNMPAPRATAIAAGVGQLAAIAAGLAAILSNPPQWWMMFIAFFVYLGAGQEAFAYRQASLVEGVPVRKAMITDFQTLTGGTTLKEAADALLSTSQEDFPVVLGDDVQGVLTRDALLRGLAETGPSGYVAGAMLRDFAVVSPDDELSDSLPRLAGMPGPLVVLDADRRLLGIVTGSNVAEFFAVRQIVAARDGVEERP